MTGETREQRLRRLADERKARLRSPATTTFARQWQRGQTIEPHDDQVATQQAAR